MIPRWPKVRARHSRMFVIGWGWLLGCFYWKDRVFLFANKDNFIWYGLFLGFLVYAFWVWTARGDRQRLEKIRMELIQSNSVIIRDLSGGNSPTALEILMKSICSESTPAEERGNATRIAWSIGHALQGQFYQFWLLDPNGDLGRRVALDLVLRQLINPNDDQSLKARARTKEILILTYFHWLVKEPINGGNPYA